MNKYNEKLKKLMDEYAHFIYKITKDFPQTEKYGITSQLRRATLSVVLNFIEGYSRKRKMVMINFYEISFGSLKESKYLLEFSFKEKLISINNYEKCVNLSEEISKMLWTSLQNLENSC